ncbi:MAG: SET domain-containing protein-lysine N-methyltransferase [Planctomycetaceae bacterium]|nr:SET domain-containing protein-lysine N-methyltransferase [Planctomycetaceae bacterium]
MITQSRCQFPFFTCDISEVEFADVVQRHHPHFVRHFPKGIRVDRTSCGLGVFTTRKLRGNRKIGRVRGRVFTDMDYTSSYCIDAGGWLSLEPAAPFCFLNHSCEPNCQFMNYIPQEEWDDDVRRRLAMQRASTVTRRVNYENTDAAFGIEMWLEALRDIEPGEQLTIDYAWPDDRAIPCLCGSDHCRGWIIAPELLNSFLRNQQGKTVTT